MPQYASKNIHCFGQPWYVCSRMDMNSSANFAASIDGVICSRQKCSPATRIAGHVAAVAFTLKQSLNKWHHCHILKALQVLSAMHVSLFNSSSGKANIKRTKWINMDY